MLATCTLPTVWTSWTKYRTVLNCDSDYVRGLFQAGIDSCTAPQAWLIATVAAVKKPKAARTIGPESCALENAHSPDRAPPARMG